MISISNIEELHANDVIGGETYLFCIENNLQTIDDLASYITNESVVCNKRVRAEVESILADYALPLVSLIEEVSSKDKPIADYLKEEYLRLKSEYSVRAQNALSRIERDLAYPSNAFWTFLMANPDRVSAFKGIRNAGRKTIDELLELADRLIEISEGNNGPHFAQTSLGSDPKALLSDITRLSDKELELYRFSIEQEKKKLSVRSQNALDRLLDENGNSIIELYQVLHSKDFDPFEMKNVGKKSVEDIIAFIKTTDDLLVDFFSAEGAVRSARLVKVNALQHAFGLTEEEAKIIIEDLSDSTSLPLFKAIDVLLKRDYRNWAIIEGSINIFREQNLVDRKIIAQKLGLTVERVRQLRNVAYAEIVKTINIWRENNAEEFSYYNAYCDLEYNDQYLDRLNESEKVNFNANFIYRVLSLLFPNSYTITGDDFASFMEPYNKGGNINIVPLELAEVFDFNNMIDDFRLKLSGKIYEDYSIDINEYLLGFFKNDIFFEQLPQISEICSKIIYRDFGVVAIDDSIKMERNAIKTIPELVEDILAENGKVMSLDELFDQFEIRNPGLTKDKDALRGSIIRNNNIVPVGRSSSYALKTWEKNGVKGGTIRDIVFDLLTDNTCPLTIEEITNHVLLYRTGTNALSIYSNLFADKSKRFSAYDFEGQRLIGLAHIKYGEKYELIDDENRSARSFNESSALLEQFIIDNDRFPFSSSEDSEEERLNRFWRLHKSKQRKGELIAEQLATINRLDDVYGDKEISKSDFIHARLTAKEMKIENENAKFRTILLAAGIDPDV